MPWNEPGGNKKDPWGSGSQKNSNQGPPNLDEIFKKLLRALSGGKNTSNNGKKNSMSGNGTGKAVVWLVIIILVVGYLYKSIYVVDQKERAVILRFGKYVETVGPGLHMYFPPIEQRFQTMVTGYRIYRVNQEMLTQDENIVSVALSVQYNINNLKDYELNVSNPVLSLEEATQSALRHVVGGSTMHQVLTEGRETMAEEVKARLQQYLDNYGTGLSVSRVNVESAQPPKQVQAAFDDVIRAREDEERSKNNAQAYANQIVPEARGQAQRIIEKANAYKAEVVALAEGKVSRFTSILNAYEKSPNVTKERLYIDTMEHIFSKATKVLLDTKTTGNIFYLPLDKLMSKHSEKDDTKALNDSVSAGMQSVMTKHIQNDQNSGRRTGRVNR